MIIVANFQQYIRNIGVKKTNYLPTTEIMGSWKALVYYRYISWFLTSVFYLLDTHHSSIVGVKLIVILSLLVYGTVTIYLYQLNKETNLDKITLVIIETLGIAVFLIPTEGLDSPFIWYALNPIFMAALLLPAIYCWQVLVCFITIASATNIYFQDITFLTVWQENCWLLLVFLLLTTVAVMFAKLLKQLSGAYDELSAAYCSSERLLKHNSDLYQALESLSYGEDSNHLADLLANYAIILSGSKATVCYLANHINSQFVVTDSRQILKDVINKARIDVIWSQLNQEHKIDYILPFKSGQTEYQLKCIPLQSLGNRFGFLGYVVSEQGDDDQKSISFLADLGAIVLERQKADQLLARLMVSEEQNRIANEIHDGVSQYLFSIAYALHGLAKKKGSLQDDDIKNQLETICSTANKAAKELRISIYRISPRRRGEQVFVTSLSSYLDGLAKLNNIKVDLQSAGSEEALSPALRKALYRIVRESTSNAVRHGRCSNIDINLQMEPAKVTLEILDNGHGFDSANIQKHGLGLANMSNLMASFKGSFQIQSSPGQGAKVTCVVPDC